jgi:hypothetical protein
MRNKPARSSRGAVSRRAAGETRCEANIPGCGPRAANRGYARTMSVPLRISAAVAACLACVASFGLLAPAASASRAYIEHGYSSDGLIVDGDPGERNQIWVGYDATAPSPHFVVRENVLGTTSATLSAAGYGGQGAECEQKTAVEVWCPPERISLVSLWGHNKNDYLYLDRSLIDSAMGELPAVHGYLGALAGQRGQDRLFGSGFNDNLSGGPGPDALGGRAGQDEVYGGDGVDALRGGVDSDRLFARDDQSDKLIDCGPGANERAELDAGLDPAPISC